MGNIVYYRDGSEVKINEPIVLDNFGSVVGISFEDSSGFIEVAIDQAEIARIFEELANHFEKKEKLEFADAIRRLDTHAMDESLSMILKSPIASCGRAKIEPDFSTTKETEDEN